MITLRLSDEEHRRFELVAADMGLDMSGMIRTLVREREKSSVLQRPKKGLKASR
jgi:antitoxin component of RelBE/YafQ-DinJ toxin-antitoxin module